MLSLALKASQGCNGCQFTPVRCSFACILVRYLTFLEGSPIDLPCANSPLFPNQRPKLRLRQAWREPSYNKPEFWRCSFLRWLRLDRCACGLFHHTRINRQDSISSSCRSGHG